MTRCRRIEISPKKYAKRHALSRRSLILFAYVTREIFWLDYVLLFKINYHHHAFAEVMAPALNLPAPKNAAENDEAIAGPSKSKAARVDDVDEVTEQSTNDRFHTGGLIFPPPELRNIVDKTAQYVARNGIEFESKIRGDNAGSNRLAFLNDEDPYHAYYQAKLEAFKSGTGPLANVNTESRPEGGDTTLGQVGEGQTSEEEKPVEPEPFKFSADMPNITALDLDIVKLTALFVAKKGRAFASTLQQRKEDRINLNS
ncbi:hypothetical protein L7F22_003101 [Adiantum nelumboides]|nr:hypothetical protein [Adiantum nelumboides]